MHGGGGGGGQSLETPHFPQRAWLDSLRRPLFSVPEADGPESAASRLDIAPAPARRPRGGGGHVGRAARPAIRPAAPHPPTCGCGPPGSGPLRRHVLLARALLARALAPQRGVAASGAGGHARHRPQLRMQSRLQGRRPSGIAPSELARSWPWHDIGVSPGMTGNP